MPSLLAERLRIAPRVAREALSGIVIHTRVPLAFLGRSEDHWFFRTPPPARPIAGVHGWQELAGGATILHTSAKDAVERERILRALHLALGERPSQELFRPAPTPTRRLTRADCSLALALVRAPWAPLDALAREARMTARAAKERLGKLVAERVLALDARPKERALRHVAVRLAPSSTAAARHALAAIPGIVRAFVPDAGEAAYVDAFAMGDADAAPAREIPGVHSVEVRAIAREWQDETAREALLRDALNASA